MCYKLYCNKFIFTIEVQCTFATWCYLSPVDNPGVLDTCSGSKQVVLYPTTPSSVRIATWEYDVFIPARSTQRSQHDPLNS